MPNKKKRNYFRKCGLCGERHEPLIRTDKSPNGWLCYECCREEHVGYEDF